MSEENTNLTASEKAAKIAIDLFKEIGNIAEQKGTRLTTIVSGIVILVLILIKNLIKDENTDVSINYIDLSLLICAVLVIAIGLVISSLEHKWYNESCIREKEIVYETYKLEMEYNIKRLELTNLQNENSGKTNTQGGGINEPPK